MLKGIVGDIKKKLSKALNCVFSHPDMISDPS